MSGKYFGTDDPGSMASMHDLWHVDDASDYAYTPDDHTPDPHEDYVCKHCGGGVHEHPDEGLGHRDPSPNCPTTYTPKGAQPNPHGYGHISSSDLVDIDDYRPSTANQQAETNHPTTPPDRASDSARQPTYDQQASDWYEMMSEHTGDPGIITEPTRLRGEAAPDDAAYYSKHAKLAPSGKIARVVSGNEKYPGVARPSAGKHGKPLKKGK